MNYNNIQNDEYVVLIQLVLVKKSDIQSFPMQCSGALQQPLQALPVQEQEALPIASTMNNAQRSGKPRKGQASPKQKDFVKTIIGRLDMDENEVCQSMNITSIDEISNRQANEFISEYKDKKPDQLF